MIHTRQKKTFLSGRSPFRHPEPCKRFVQIIVERFHNPEKFRCLGYKCFRVFQFSVLQRIFQIPTLIFQIFRLRMPFLISRRDILQCRPLHRKIFFKFRIMYDSFPFFTVPGNVIPYHRRCVLKHIRKQASS